MSGSLNRLMRSGRGELSECIYSAKTNKGVDGVTVYNFYDNLGYL